jgi:hypothetical protein
MGMYTELVLNVKLKNDVPAAVITMLQYMVGALDNPPELPVHELFNTDRWPMVLNSGSYYFIPRSNTKLIHDAGGSWYLSSRADLKNYDSTTEKFVDWLMPYIDGLPGEFLGYSRYEDDDDPTLIRYREKPALVAAEEK